MKYNFDQIIDRHNTDCLKYDFAKEWGYPEDVLSLWVADMDFPTATPVIEALKAQAEKGIYGYSDSKEDYFQAGSGWYERHFGWKPEKEWLVKTPGVVFALAMCVRSFTQPGDGVLIQRPVYGPFTRVVTDNGRKLVNCPLVLEQGKYRMDFAGLEKAFASGEVKLMLLCSPHNPVGRVWDEEELRRLEELALAHHVIVVSDEIHSDFVWDGKKHHVLMGLDPAYQENVVVCTAPSKTFNLAGLQCSNIFIANETLRKQFNREMAGVGYGLLNAAGLTACKAAYQYGEEWLDQLKAYIRGNIAFLEDYCAAHMPGVCVIHPEGTYLVWMDFRALGLSQKELDQRIGQSAGVWLDTGTMFGNEGEGFQRVNTACPRSILEQALERLRSELCK